MREITVILHNIRSTHNVGSIFRTCDGFGVRHIILSGYTPYPTHPGDTRLPHIAQKLTNQIHKTALGAERTQSFSYVSSLDTWLDHNDRTDRLPIFALEQTPRSVVLSDFIPPQAFALLLGEEVAGVDEKYLKRCEAILEIPMYGRKESFNVSVSTGIALYALQT